jgi:hypothetical protein
MWYETIQTIELDLYCFVGHHLQDRHNWLIVSIRRERRIDKSVNNYAKR